MSQATEDQHNAAAEQPSRQAAGIHRKSPSAKDTPPKARLDTEAIQAKFEEQRQAFAEKLQKLTEKNEADLARRQAELDEESKEAKDKLKKSFEETTDAESTIDINHLDRSQKFLSALEHAFGKDHVSENLDSALKNGSFDWMVSTLEPGKLEGGKRLFGQKEKSVTFTDLKTGSHFYITRNKILFTDSNKTLSGREALQMAWFAAQDLDMINDNEGVELTGSDEDRAKLQIAIDLVNRDLPANMQIKIDNPLDPIQDKDLLKQARTAFKAPDIRRNGNATFGNNEPYANWSRMEKEAKNDNRTAQPEKAPEHKAA